VHYANSTAIRLANIYSKAPVYCNRGVNGIEGSLSTAAGFSLVAHPTPNTQHLTPNTQHLTPTFCIIGDLSFFYDQNALWNQNLRGNLRILLLNNGKGGIFDTLPGLEQSPARDRLVAAQHSTSAEGICRQSNVGYRRAENMQQMQQGIDWLITTESSHPLLLEVMTD
jgi:2-succinyl-5-enolpyruvyl-6-hydroxy-3-cyclohexene-1-carboxylate synthase